MGWIVFFKIAKCLPGSLSQKLATVSTADECTVTILRFTDDHAPGAQELVSPFVKLSLFLSLLHS